MTTFKLTMNLDNAAFADGEAVEVARILREVAAAVEANNGPAPLATGEWPATMRDANGNKVGYYEVTT